MNFSDFVKKTEKPLPLMGLVRSHRNPEVNAIYYQEALMKKNNHCFNYELNMRCNSYKSYQKYKYQKKIIYNIICKSLCTDIVNYIFEYYDVVKIDYIPELDYRIIKTKLNFKWYIIISNILYMIKECYHREILDISKIMIYYSGDSFYEKFKLFMKEFGKITPLDINSLNQIYSYENIFDLARQVRDKMLNIMIDIYYEIKL